jgi:cysteine synthase B
MQKRGEGKVLDQFGNADNPRIHYETTGPELWEQTGGRITHFVSAMGTTGTITGVSRLPEGKKPGHPDHRRAAAGGLAHSGHPQVAAGIPAQNLRPAAVDELVYVSQDDAEEMCRRLAREEGIFAGISAAGACWVAQQIAQREQRHHRVCGVRPGRPLPVYRRVSCLKQAQALDIVGALGFEF